MSGLSPRARMAMIGLGLLNDMLRPPEVLSYRPKGVTARFDPILPDRQAPRRSVATRRPSPHPPVRAKNMPRNRPRTSKTKRRSGHHARRKR